MTRSACWSTLRPSARSRTPFTNSSGTPCISAISFTRRSGSSCGSRWPTTSMFSATMFDRLSEKNRWYRDFTLDALTLAVRETIACFPVYRTYLAPDRPVSDDDRAVIERAVAAAKRRNPGARGIGLQFPARHSALPLPGKPGRRSARRARAFRPEISADAPGRSWRRGSRTRPSTFTTGWRR